MASRYDNRRTFRNGAEIYFNILEARGLTTLVQYKTPRFKKISKRERQQHFTCTKDMDRRRSSL